MQSHTPKGFQTKKKIFETSIALMHERGYENTTMKDISEKSGVGIGTIYHHFKNKIDIINQFVMNEEEEISNYMSGHRFISSKEKLEALINLQFDFLEIKHKEFLAVFTANSVLDPNDNIFMNFVTRHLLLQILSEGETNNEFKCINSPKYVSEVIITLLIGYIVVWSSSRSNSTDKIDHEELQCHNQIILDTLHHLIRDC